MIGSQPPRSHHSFSMLGWALNEEENVRQYVERAEVLLRSWTNDFELIVIDDGSTDGTWNLLEKLATSRPWLKVFRNDRNRGATESFLRALPQASKDYVFWQTVDWAYAVDAFADYLPLLGRTVDILQGFRQKSMTLSGVLCKRSDTPWKGFISFVNYWTVRTLFRLPLSDYQNVTIYPRELLQSLTLQSRSSFGNPELLLKAWRRGASFQEVPVIFAKRQRGQAKGTRWKNILSSVIEIIMYWLLWEALGAERTTKVGRVLRWSEVDLLGATPLESRSNECIRSKSA